MTELAFAVLGILIILLLVFLGDRTAAGLQRLVRDWKEYKEKTGSGTDGADDS